MVIVTFLRQCVTEKVPPADSDSLRGHEGALFAVLLLRFVVGAGWWFFVAFLRLVRN